MNILTRGSYCFSFQGEISKYDKICEEAYVNAKQETAVHNKDWLDSPWPGFFEGKNPMEMPSTNIQEDAMARIGEAVSTNPEDFKIHGGKNL